jgi:hypothetical protein
MRDSRAGPIDLQMELSIKIIPLFCKPFTFDGKSLVLAEGGHRGVYSGADAGGPAGGDGF